MPIRIDEMSTTLEIQDEERLRRLVRAEVERALRDWERRGRRRTRPDPADPTASVREDE